MNQFRPLPARVRAALGVLYLTGIGLILAAETISLLANFTAGYLGGLLIEAVLLVHLVRKGLL